MSVEDETWDRPICKLCNKEIAYGDVRSHSTTKCLDDVSLYKQVKPLNKKVAENLRNYLIRVHNILAHVAQKHPETNFRDMLDSLKFQSK